MTPDERRQKKRPPLFVPRSLADFADGGAFPEIHVAQYPRHMGNPQNTKKKQPPAVPTNTSTATTTTDKHAKGSIQSAEPILSRAIVNVEVDQHGEISYDAIVKRGTNADKIVYSRHEDLRGGEPDPDDVALPTAEEEAAEAARTQAALQALLGQKTALDKPSGSALAHVETSKNVTEKTQFIQYAARPDAPGYNPAAAQRVIQMVPAQVDPMMPPKHKHVKAPRGPAEDPVPVLHAPPKKLTKEERDAWNVPACISNWKNSRGFTIPLDKRLAADGRGLRDYSINDNFATLSESLYVAERQARQEVRLRAQVQKKLALQEKEKREAELREMANQARMERGGGLGGGPLKLPDNEDGAVSSDENDGHEEDRYDDRRRGAKDDNYNNDDDESAEEDPRRARQDIAAPSRREETEEEVAARQREKLRIERKRERERELRQQSNMELKKKRLEEERDVSEKIALGVHTGAGGLGGGDVDARLYNQTAGMDSGFGADDEYNAYSKPLFDRQAAISSASIYRPTRGESEYNAEEQYDTLVKGATTKFQADKGFAGAEGGMDVQAGPRTAPVQFEKATKN